MIQSGRKRIRRSDSRITILLLGFVLLLCAAFPAQAENCSDFPGGVLDGFTGTPAPSQIQIDRNCTIRNFTASNPLDTNFSFYTQPGQTDERWLVIFDNVIHTGQMACNSVAGHAIWFTNGSSTQIQEDCQNLLIPVEKIDKQNPTGQTTATIGVPFTYTLTMPVLYDPGTGTVINHSGSLNDLHGVMLTDDLNATGVDLTYVSHVAYWKGSGAPVAHTFTNVGGLLTFDNFPIIPAGEQIVIELTVVLEDSPTNISGRQFINTAKWEFGRLIDGVYYAPLPGEWGISEPLTIAAPELVVTKTGPATLGRTLNLGQWGEFGLDVHNVGLSEAWNVTLLDRLPDDPNGGLCNMTPQILSAQVFQADGVTPVPGKGPLVAGTDFSFGYAGAPTCELTLAMLTPAAVIGAGERLIVTYRTQLDADSQDGTTHTNVAGATEWFNGNTGNGNRQSYTRTLTDGTVGVPDHQDAHTVTVALSGFFFEKTVEDLTSGVNPATTAAPGDRLRYTLRLQATDVPLSDLTFYDDLGALNSSAVFEPGSLAVVTSTLPPGANASSTNPSGGTNRAGLLDIRNLSVPVNSEVRIQFEVTLDPTLGDGTTVTNQADLLSIGNVKLAASDDPNVNGQADPDVVGDEDPTQLVIAPLPIGPLAKENTQATAAIGEAFSYRITVPATPYPLPIYDVRITDDLTASAADLRFLGVSRVSGPGTWTPVNTGTDKNLVIEDTRRGIDIPAGEQIVLEIRVVLEDTPTNVSGLTFRNTASFTFNRVDSEDMSSVSGEPATTADMTIVGPDQLTVRKSGPTGISLGGPAIFGLDVQNTGTGRAWQPTLVDQLPNLNPGGTCDIAPANVRAQVFAADGTTPVSGLLVENTDFTTSFAPAPTCELSLNFLTPEASLGPNERLIVRYETFLDVDTPDGTSLTNVAGATQWFSADDSDPATAGDRHTYTRTLTDGTVGVLDHEDAHTTLGAVPLHTFEKTVANLTTGANPATQASPGDRLRYTIRIQNIGSVPMTDFSLEDELDRLNGPPAFERGTLTIVTLPAGADASNTNSTGGSAGTGTIEVTGLNLPNSGDNAVIEFEVDLANALPNGSLVLNQAELLVEGNSFSASDDPNVNGPADPTVSGDEDPTQVQITSAPEFRVEKISTDLTGDPAILLAGETLRYTITVKNIGTDSATGVTLRDAVPVNTTYVAGSTRLNGAPVPDGPSASSPLVTGILINAPEDPTPGAMPADTSTTPDNVATLVFDVVVDPGVSDGTIISNQAFVNSLPGGVINHPSDDPTTSLPDDPTRDVVGSVPLLFATKDATLQVDNGTPGVADPGDVLRYTIVVYNNGAVPATNVVLHDTVPANTTYRVDSMTLNDLAVGRPDNGVSPLIAGIPISSSDLTPPLPLNGAGTLSPGESATIVFELEIDAGTPGGTIISNQALITTAEAPNLLTDGDGDPATGPEPTLVVVGAGQQLSITKQVAVVGGGPALADSELEYLVTVRNISTTAATNVVILDDLDAPTPGQLSYVPGSATLNGVNTGVSFAGATLTADYSTSHGPLDPGSSLLLRFRATLDAGLAQGTPVTNVAQVHWNSPVQTASASVSVSVGGMPGVAALRGSLWHDSDFDRAIGGSEQRLVGWLVDLYRNGQLILTVEADASGNFVMSGLEPNDLSGDTYELRFRAPDATASSASLGTPDSPFTNVPQRITNVVLTSGSNLQGVNLPISPNGVVYSSIQRTTIAGATLHMLDASGSSALPAACFDDPVQQGQITRGDGRYKFDLNFSDPACPEGGSYVVEVVPPGAGYVAGSSSVIPPTTDASTSPLSVPTCGSGPDDAVPATPQHCEIQVSEFAPTTAVAPRTAGTNYHLHLSFDNTQGEASAQVFNNHIPLDPAADSVLGITKVTPKVNVVVGELVPYEIVVNNQLDMPLSGFQIVDRFPAGFRYIQGSAQIEGIKMEPLQTGQELVWAGLEIEPRSPLSLKLILAVGAGVTEGEFTNAAQVVDSSSGVPLTAEANATVRVVPDPDFACTDVLGKVFDDRNLDGDQDPGEDGLPGVRLVTARGLVATTDAHGRFHITCAVVPDERRGSNFILKLDDRSLPAGYRMSTPQAQVKRATRGKALRFDYGASIHRVVALDLADPVFEPGTTEMREQWKPRVDLLIEELAKSPSTLRLAYAADTESRQLVEARLEQVKKFIAEHWQSEDRYRLRIETQIVGNRGEPAQGFDLKKLRRGMLGAIASPFVDDDGVERIDPASRTEHELPSDEPLRLWALDPDRDGNQASDKLEIREVLTDQAETRKLRGVIPPIHFASGSIDIPSSSIEKLREVLQRMSHLDNVRLHLVGHADNQPLSPQLARTYEDNFGLSKERAGEVAEFLKLALSLPPESISFEGLGSSQPVASNATNEGRRQNRRVEVEVWYDVMGKKVGFEDVVIPEEVTQVKVCRIETLCKMRFREGHEHRARLRNLVAPLQLGAQTVQVPPEFIQEIEGALHHLRDQQNVTVKFIGYSEDAALSERAERIYGTQLALSTARAHRVALAVKEALKLPSSAIASEGRGTTRPVASNATERGRELNRRVEVEFWYDDPLQELPDTPQVCPDDGGTELITRVYDPPWGRIEPILVEGGKPIIPEGYGEQLKRALEDVADRRNPRLRFVGYVRNERLDRRTALDYGDDIGLATARARRTMEQIQSQLGLRDEQVEHEGRGFLHSNDVVNAGFIQGDTSEVRVQVVYDESAVVDDLDGIDITPVRRELSPQNLLELNLMRISVDGKPIDDPGRSSADLQRCTDVALDERNIRFYFDDLGATPRLTVSSEPIAVPVWTTGGGTAGDAATSELGPTTGPLAQASTVRFRAYTNYSHFIDRMEVRIFDEGQSLRGEPVGVVPVGEDGIALWSPPTEPFPSPMRPMKFVLRAYDAEGHFDETVSQPLWVVHGIPTSSPTGSALTDAAGSSVAGSGVLLLPEGEATVAPTLGNNQLFPGYGEVWPVLRNIPLGSAGTVRVEGGGITSDQSIAFAGRPVPVSEEGRFVAEEILPSGVHSVEFAVEGKDGNSKLYLRDLELDRNDWFYTGIADLTFSGGNNSGNASALEGANSNTDLDSNADGRLAFYVTGKFGDDWKLTASADTREGPLDDIFHNFVEASSPYTLFRRIDSDYHYPTFGDDGTVEETAPTQGKLYLKLSKDQSHLLWGNFRSEYLDNELTLVERGLYGGDLRYRSRSTTSFGEKRLAVEGFAADPGTVSAREEFRGTGGSLFYLSRSDLTIGSERIRIEIRDKDSGLVKSVVHLTPGTDYDIDYLQGRILLSEPLPATVGDSLLVRTGGLSGDEAFLMVQYEYAPGFADVNGLATGGQAHYWFGDFLKLGVTASRDNTGDEDTSLYGADVTLRRSDDSWIKVQFGRSEGPVSSTSLSEDGGFEFVQGADLSLVETDANAYRTDVVTKLSDFLSGMPGRLTLYGQQLDAGYSAPGLAAPTDTRQAGGTLDLPILQRLNLAVKSDWLRREDGLETSSMEADLKYMMTEHWSVSGGVRGDDRQDDSPITVATQEEGRRTDAVIEIGYDSKGAWRAYGFGQGTINSTGDREDNNRYGAGGKYRVNDKLSMNGEVSGGDGGLGAELGTTYQYSEDTGIYLTYGLESERSVAGSRRRGNLITGAKSRLSDSTSVYVENRYTHSTVDTGLLQTAGIRMEVFDHWTVGTNVEIGTLTDRDTAAETRRHAAGGRVGYKFENVDFFTNVEYRYDETEHIDRSWTNRTTWLFRNALQIRLNPDWQLLGKFNHSFSDSSQGSFFDGSYTEAVLGYAYRPIENDRLNALVKYTYFYNMPTTDQVGGSGVANQFVQKSHIAAVDVTYDIRRNLSIGGKYAYRRGELSLDRVNPEFFDNSAHLFILRSDYRILENWEGLVEGRMLDMPDINERKSGALLAIYRYFGEHFKAGVGYNFTDFSEDLTDLSYNDHGWFLNLVGSF